MEVPWPAREHAHSVLSILTGIIMCRLMYTAMKALSPAFSVAYLKLPKAQQVEWDSRGFSTLHAIVVTGTAAYLLFFSDFFRDSGPHGPVVFRTSLLSQTVLGISLGYFVSDLAMICWFYPALGGKEFVLHHFLSMASIAMALFSGHAHIYIYLVLFTEITTPLVNARWYLCTANMKNSKAYLVNGILLFFMWLLARVLLFIHFFLHIYWHFDQVSKCFTAGFYFLFIAPPGLALMNLFWFYKILLGVLRALSKKA